jgi:hypothetical protein
MAKAKTLVGLDVYATKIVAAVLDAETEPGRLFDGDLETRISVLGRGTPRSCHDRRSTR